MKTTTAIALIMAVLFTGSAAQAGTQEDTTTAERSSGASGVSSPGQAVDACEFQYNMCLHKGGDATQCFNVKLMCLLEKWRTQQTGGNGHTNHEEADIDGDALKPELEAGVVDPGPMTCVNPPCSPWDTQSTEVGESRRDAKAESAPARSPIQQGPVPQTISPQTISPQDISTTKTQFAVEVYVYTEEERSQQSVFPSLITARDRFLDLYRCSIVRHEKWKSLHLNSILTPEGSSLPFYRYGALFMAECRLDPAQDSDNINFSAPNTPGGVMNQEEFDFKCTDQQDEGITIGKFPRY